jgi:hypothetical protein
MTADLRVHSGAVIRSENARHTGRIIVTGTYHVAQEVDDGVFVVHERRGSGTLNLNL